MNSLTATSLNVYIMYFFGDKRAEREAYHSSPSSSKYWSDYQPCFVFRKSWM